MTDEEFCRAQTVHILSCLQLLEETEDENESEPDLPQVAQVPVLVMNPQPSMELACRKILDVREGRSNWYVAKTDQGWVPQIF
jgi:hypothetical protein